MMRGTLQSSGNRTVPGKGWCRYLEAIARDRPTPKIAKSCWLDVLTVSSLRQMHTEKCQATSCRAEAVLAIDWARKLDRYSGA